MAGFTSPSKEAQNAFDEIRSRWLAMLAVPRVRAPGSSPRVQSLLDWEGDDEIKEPNIEKLWLFYVPFAKDWNEGRPDVESIVAQQANVNMAQGWVDQINKNIAKAECFKAGTCTPFYRLPGMAGDGKFASFDIEKGNDLLKTAASTPEIERLPSAMKREVKAQTKNLLQELGNTIGETAGNAGAPILAGFWKSLSPVQKVALVGAGGTVALGAVAFGIAQLKTLIPVRR